MTEISELLFEIKSYTTALHVVGAIVGIGTAIASDIMFSFYSRDRIFTALEKKILERLSRIIWVSLTIITVSGLALFLSDPATYAASSKFLTKMSIVGVLILNGYTLSRWIQPHIARGNFLTSKKERSARMFAFACGAISLVSWFSAFGLGMLDGTTLSYCMLMAFYGGVLIVGISTALVIEKLEFE